MQPIYSGTVCGGLTCNVLAAAATCYNSFRVPPRAFAAFPVLLTDEDSWIGSSEVFANEDAQRSSCRVWLSFVHALELTTCCTSSPHKDSSLSPSTVAPAMAWWRLACCTTFFVKSPPQRRTEIAGAC